MDDIIFGEVLESLKEIRHYLLSIVLFNYVFLLNPLKKFPSRQ